MRAGPKSTYLRCLLGVLLLLLACASQALAARPHEFATTFGEHCAAEPCEKAQLKKPNGVAVNEASGDVYVVDEGEAGQHGRVVRFDSKGKFQSEFDGSGTHGEGAAAGGGGKLGELPTGRFEEPQGIAVDNSCALRKVSEPELTLPQCEKEDPSNGDVYLLDAGSKHRVIDKYGPAGKYLGQLTEAGGLKFSSEPLDGVAVDPSGRVWVYREEPVVVDGFTNANPNVFAGPQIELHQINGHGFAAPGFAVDANGDFYGRLQAGIFFPPRIVKWDHAGNVLLEQLGSEEASAVALDQINGTVYVDDITSVGAFDPEGRELERLGREHGAEHLSAGAGIGVNAATSFLYVADPTTGPVLAFGPAEPSAPQVEGESFSGVGEDRATLAAEINPRSLEKPEEGLTEYQFEYGRCATLDPASCAASGYEALTAPGALPPDFEVHPVSAEVEGLFPNTTYHFRAIARNKRGEGPPGEELSFTTEGAGGEVLLPDNRGYELVSPPDKQGALIEPITETGVVQAAASGAGITYLATSPVTTEPQGYANRAQALSRRSAAAWSTRDISIAHSAATGLGVGTGPEYQFFDAELSLSAVQPFGQFIPELSEEASESTAYLHALGESCASHCFRPLVTGKAGFANVPEGTQFGEDELCVPSGSRSEPEVLRPEIPRRERRPQPRGAALADGRRLRPARCRGSCSSGPRASSPR